MRKQLIDSSVGILSTYARLDFEEIMRHILTLATVASFGLAGCAEQSTNVQGTYVSPIAYGGYTCRQLSEEGARVSGRAAEIAGVQDKNARNDAVATGVTLVLFWPAAFFIKGNKENRAELARLKGEKDAIEQASIKRNCGVQFRDG